MKSVRLVGLEEAVVFALEEVQLEIKANGISRQEKAMLFHQLGSLHMLKGNKGRQIFSWLKAILLDPKNPMIKGSLKSLW
jgi:hypothetical protein